MQIREAVGPFRLDLGDILYAPNTLLDPDNVSCISMCPFVWGQGRGGFECLWTLLLCTNS
jgi:hypothetical protein